jgi:hypothetical protein
MNDNELITAMRDQRNKVHMTTPVEQIINRGHAVRARRRIPGLAGVLAVAAAAAFAVIALLPASHPASHQPPAHLAAWTVTRLPNGDIGVTVREMADPAGLQSTLRADGVPASVTLLNLNPACQPYPGGKATLAPYYPGRKSTLQQRLQSQFPPLLLEVFPTPFEEQKAEALARNQIPLLPSPNGVVVIDPSALPGNTGVELVTAPGGSEFIEPEVVYASPQCTGPQPSPAATSSPSASPSPKPTISPSPMPGSPSPGPSPTSSG